MRILSFDIETTGFDFQKDRIIELGWVLYDWDLKKVLVAKTDYLYHTDYPDSSESALASHGITRSILEEFGKPPKEVLFDFSYFLCHDLVTVVAGHNVREFDLPFLNAEFVRNGIGGTMMGALLDTRVDIPFSQEPDSRKLKYMAAEVGYINPFPHRALFDALTVLKVLEPHDIQKCLVYASIPSVRLEAQVTFDQKDKAKQRGYRWDGENRKWFKNVKETEVLKEQATAPFKIEVLGPI